MPIDKDVITLEVSVNYWRIMAMQINKPPEDLPCPAFNSSDVHPFVLLPVSVLENI